MKTLTRKQLEARKAQAVRFTEDVLDDPDLADELEDLTPEEYAERRRIKISNPKKGGRHMSVPSRRELLETIKELEEENDDLHDRLGQIGDLAGTEDEEEGDEEEGEPDSGE